MKIKNIAVLCKAGKRIHLIDIVDGGGYKQWIGDGNGMYPIVGLPYLNKEEIFTLFEIEAEKQNDFYFSHEENTEMGFYENAVQGEKPIKGETFEIITSGATVRPMITRSGIRFLDTRYLAPTVKAIAQIKKRLKLFARNSTKRNVLEVLNDE